MSFSFQSYLATPWRHGELFQLTRSPAESAERSQRSSRGAPWAGIRLTIRAQGCEVLDDVLWLAVAHQGAVDEVGLELVAQGPVGQGGHDRAVDASAQGVDGHAGADGALNVCNLVVNELPAIHPDLRSRKCCDTRGPMSRILAARRRATAIRAPLCPGCAAEAVAGSSSFSGHLCELTCSVHPGNGKSTRL